MRRFDGAEGGGEKERIILLVLVRLLVCNHGRSRVGKRLKVVDLRCKNGKKQTGLKCFWGRAGG